MTGWVSAREALRLLGEHREDPTGVLIARAADGARARASRMSLGNDRIEGAELGHEFWEAMQDHSTSQDWSAGEFTCSGYGDLCRAGRDGPTFDAWEKLVWRATGVEFYWPDMVRALNLPRSRTRPYAPKALFERWLERHRSTLWGEREKQRRGPQWIKDRFEEEHPDYCLRGEQLQQVLDAWPTAETRKPGRPSKSAAEPK